MRSPTPGPERAGRAVATVVLALSRVGAVLLVTLDDEDSASPVAADGVGAPGSPDSPDSPGSPGTPGGGTGGRADDEPAPEGSGSGAQLYVPEPGAVAEVRRVLREFPYPPGTRRDPSGLREDDDAQRFRVVRADLEDVKVFYDGMLPTTGLVGLLGSGVPGGGYSARLTSRRFDGITGTLFVGEQPGAPGIVSIQLQVLP